MGALDAGKPKVRPLPGTHGVWQVVAVLAVAGQLAAVGALFVWMGLREPAYVAVATGMGGGTAPVVAEDDAGADMQIGVLLTWTVATVTQALTIGFDDWQERIEALRGRFTKGGFDAYLAVLEESLVLERLRKQRQKVSAVAQGAPVLVRVRRLEDGRMGYEVEFPLLLTFYAGEGSKLDEKLAARAVVARMPRKERFAGLALEAVWLARRVEARG